MAQHPDKKIISLIGPPGSGKGTQADMAAENFGLHHFDTSRILRKFLANAPPDDVEAKKEKELYEKGELLSPPFATRVVLNEIKAALSEINGVVFSGSPRTVYEAENEMPVFEQLVGKNNLFVFYVNISREESVKRNGSRLVCEKSRHPIPNLPEYEEARRLGVCPEDGSRLIKRSLDKPEMIAKRYDVFLRDTRPMLDKIKEMGYKVIDINGEQPIADVFKDISEQLTINN